MNVYCLKTEKKTKILGTILWLSTTVDYSWQIEKLESWHWELATDNQRVTWTAFTLRAMFSWTFQCFQKQNIEHQGKPLLGYRFKCWFFSYEYATVFQEKIQFECLYPILQSVPSLRVSPDSRLSESIQISNFFLDRNNGKIVETLIYFRYICKISADNACAHRRTLALN